MHFRRQLNALIINIAIIAMLMAVFAPSVSRLLAQRADFTTTICRVPTQALKVSIRATQRGGSEEHPQGHQLDCGYCAMQADLPFLSVADITLVSAIRQHQTLPLRFYLSPKPLQAWRGVQSRAPPLI